MKLRHDVVILFWLLTGWILKCHVSRVAQNSFLSASRKYDARISQGASENSPSLKQNSLNHQFLRYTIINFIPYTGITYQ